MYGALDFSTGILPGMPMGDFGFRALDFFDPGMA
jgi:hypothetical protein